MKERVEKVIAITNEHYQGVRDREFLWAYVNCLNDEETVELLLYSCVDFFGLRDIALRKLEHDIADGIRPEHKKLVRELIKKSKLLKFREANSIAYCLSRILDYSKGKNERKIVEFLLNSKRVSFRRRGLKYLLGNFKKKYEEQVLNVWDQFHDFETLKLIVYNFPTEYLFESRKMLAGHIEEGWLASKLYLKIGKEHPEVLDELLDYGTPTYCYCLAKLQLMLPVEKKKGIQLNTENDGLLLWSLGRLGEWQLIEKLEKQ